MSLHVIIGEDDYRVSELAKKLVGGIADLEVIDSLTSSNEELRLADIRRAESSYFTPPFLEPRKATWWKRVGFFPQGGNAKDATSEAVKEALEKLAERFAAAPLPDNQVFVISGPRLLANSIVAKTFKSCSEMTVFPAQKPNQQARDAVARVVEEAAGLGLTFAPGVAEQFVARVGSDTRLLLSELEKLRTYLGDGSSAVKAADVAAVVSRGAGTEPQSWDLTDAIGSRDVAKALAVLHELEGEKGFAVYMTTVIEKLFRQLCEFKDATTPDRRALAGRGLAPFQVSKIMSFLPKWTLRELRVARSRFLRLRERCVQSSASSDEMVAVELLRALCGGKGRP